MAADLAALAALVGFALWSLGFLIRDDLYIFADNAGTYLRLWWLLDVAGPVGLQGWNPSWWAGWPEWQFYPPGYGIAGLLIQALSFGRLSSVQIYQTLLLFSYLLPALVAYVSLSRIGLGRWVGLTAGFFLLVFTDLYGGVGGVLIGMLGDRPSLGLAPLAWLAGVSVATSRRPALPIAGFAVVVAAMALLHPFRLLLPALLIPITVLLLPDVPKARALAAVAVGFAVGLALTGFWLVPYLAHSGLATPVLRAPLETLSFWLMGGRLPFFLVFAAWGVVRATVAPARERALVVALAVAPVLILGLMLLDWLVLVDWLGSASLDPIRFIEDVYLAVLLLAAVGFVDLVRLAVDRAKRAGRPWGVLAGGVATSLLVYLVVQPFPRWLEYYRPAPGSEPKFLREATSAYQLDDLWATLRANPGGRVLFTSSVFRLRQTGGSIPSHLMALAPALSGRETIGGTFQHWTPISTFYWQGGERPRMMTERTDLKDDQTIFGLRWREMDEPALLAALRALNVTDVVASEYDVWTRTYLDRSPAFETVRSTPFYNVYRVKGYQPTLAEGRGATVRATVAPPGVVLQVDSAQQGAEVLLKQTYFPLWRADSTGGEVVVEPDEIGLTRLRLPAGSGYQVTLRYQPGMAERAGQVISAMAVLVLGGLLAYALIGLVGDRALASSPARRVEG
ncbi:MAG: hypothetical protein U0556_11865 [Dehalococcoidia bacterium]